MNTIWETRKKFVGLRFPVAVLFSLMTAFFFTAKAQTADPVPYSLIANPLPDTMDHQRRDSVNLKFSRIRINKAGYRPQDEKLFYYVGSSASSFSVINLATGATAAAGTLASLGAATTGQLKMTCYWKASLVSGGAIKYTMESPPNSGTVYKGLIPDLPEGRYKITIGSEESAPFVINANVYGMIKDALLKYYGIARCGNNDSWFHSGCHLKDAVAGGWHDAGDHLKIGQTIGYTFAVVGLCAAALKDRDADHYAKNQSLTFNTDGIPDALIEVKVGADYMVNSYQAAGGKVANMITEIGENGADHNWWGRPQFQDAQPPNRGGPPRPTAVGLGGNTCGSLAAGLAFFGKLYALYDTAYAAQCIKIAKELYAYGKPVMSDYHNPMYGGGGRSNDEKAFAALALWWATKENLYKNDLLYDKTIGTAAAPVTYPRGGFSGGWMTAKQAGMLKDNANSDYDNMDSYVLWGLFRLILIDEATAASYGIDANERLNLIEDILYCQIANFSDLNEGDQTITLPKPDFQWRGNTLQCSNLWGWMKIQQDWMVNRYQSGNITDVFCYYDVASKIQGTELPNSPATTDWKAKEVKSVLLKQLNYMLGMNLWDVSMIVGVGNKNLNHPHHRASDPELQNVPGTFYKYNPPVGALTAGYVPTVAQGLYNEFMGGNQTPWLHSEISIDATTAIFLPVMGLAKEDSLVSPSATVRIVYAGCDKAIVEIRQTRYGISTIHYGTAAGTLDKTKASDSAGVFHTITLTGLTEGTTYYFNVEVKDLLGKSSTILDLDPDKVPVPFSFTTLANCPTNAQIPYVKICSVTSDSAEIFWYTPNGAFDSKVVYGTSKPPTIVHDGDNSGHPTNFHFVTIGGLKERTTYYFYVQSGNTINDNNGQYYTFTTPVEHVEFDVRAVRYTWEGFPAMGINVINQDKKAYDSLEVRLYFRAKESDNFENDLGARLDIMVLYREDGYQDQIEGALRTMIWQNLVNQKPKKMDDTYDPTDDTYAYYLALPMWGVEMRSQSRIRLDVMFNKREPTRLIELINESPVHQITNNDWSFGPHSTANGAPINFPGIPIGTKDDVDQNYFTLPIDYYITVYRKNEFIWGYSPSFTEQQTKKTHYEMKTQVTSPLMNPSQDYVFFERATPVVNVSGWAEITPIDGTINEIWVNGVKAADPSTLIKWNIALNRYDFTIPVPVKNGRNNVDITLFGGPSAICQECYGCAASNHSFFIEFRGAKQYPSELILKTPGDVVIQSGDTVHIDTTVFNIIVIDRNGNLNGRARDTLCVSVINPGTADSMSITLLETGDSTSQFVTMAPLTIVGNKTGDNQILMNAGDVIFITYVDPTDPTDTKSAQLVTKADFPIAQRGWLLDANGDGRADSAVVVYNKALTAAPDSVRLYFPDSATAQIAKTGQGTMTINGAMLCVSFAVPFAVATTAFSPGPRGTGVSSFTVQGILKKNTFSVADSIGPILLSGQVVERLQQGRDTLYIALSEAISPQSLIGASLILIQNGTSTPIVVTAFKLVAAGIYMVTLDTGSIVPREGDSLRINPDGPLRDQAAGNAAHKLNPAVELGIRQIPPKILFAYYVDRDSGKADGFVDAAFIRFNKKVGVTGLWLVFDWGNDLSLDTVREADLSYSGTDSVIVLVDLRKAITKRPFLKTSGNLYVMPRHTSFPGAIDNAQVVDSAAPVIKSAVYTFSTENTSCDTLSVFFSEPTKIRSDPDIAPFQFLSGSTLTRYTLAITLIPSVDPSMDTVARFCISASSQNAAPQSGDSIWIDPAGGVCDLLGILQNNEKNRKVAFRTYQPSAPLRITVLGSPLRPGTPLNVPGINANGAAIVISTENPKAKLLRITGHIRIYDILGSRIYENDIPLSSVNTEFGPFYYFNWAGRNKHNRYVGSGTYRLVVSVSDENGYLTEKKTVIGVKR